MDAESVAGALSHLLEVKTPARAFNSDVVSGVEAVDEATGGRLGDRICYHHKRHDNLRMIEEAVANKPVGYLSKYA